MFLDNIFLRVAENPNSTFGHKMMILQVFSKLAQDPQTIVDIFLNYDCDDKAVPIFQHLVSVLEKITQVFLSANCTSCFHTSSFCRQHLALTIFTIDAVKPFYLVFHICHFFASVPSTPAFLSFLVSLDFISLCFPGPLCV